MPPAQNAHVPRKQILEWVYEKGVADPAQMSNLSKLDREQLAAGMTFLSGATLAHQAASDGVQKLLIEWEDFGSQAAAASASTSGGLNAEGAGDAEEKKGGAGAAAVDGRRLD